MPMKPTPGAFRLEGTQDLEQVLKRLPNRVAGRVLRQAAMAGARPVRERANVTAPVSTGELRDSIIARAIKSSDRNRVTVRVGPSRKGFWGLFKEFGTSVQSERPWFRPAWEASKGEAVNRIGAALGTSIEKAAKRLAGPLAKAGLIRRKSGRR